MKVYFNDHLNKIFSAHDFMYPVNMATDVIPKTVRMVCRSGGLDTAVAGSSQSSCSRYIAGPSLKEIDNGT